MDIATFSYIERLIKNDLGGAQDDLNRARAAFRGQDMTKEHGQSGRTRAQILESYEMSESQAKDALAKLQELKPAK